MTLLSCSFPLALSALFCTAFVSVSNPMPGSETNGHLVINAVQRTEIILFPNLQCTSDTQDTAAVATAATQLQMTQLNFRANNCVCVSGNTITKCVIWSEIPRNCRNGNATGNQKHIFDWYGVWTCGGMYASCNGTYPERLACINGTRVASTRHAFGAI